MRILFCTDGSKISYNALENFIHWSRDGICDIITVIDWSFLPEEIQIEDEGFTTTCANIADSILDVVSKKFSGSNLVLGNGIKHCGETVSSILEQTEEEHYDIILMGSHGKKGIQRWLGSVSRDVIENTKQTVYVSKNKNCCKRILFAVDGSDNSNFAVSEVIKYLNLREKEIYICVVNESPNLLFLEGNLDSRWLLEIEKQQEKLATSIIANVGAKLAEYDLEIKEYKILTGIPAEEIINYSRDEGIDLIITGAKTKSNMRSSVSKKILTETTSDIMIVRQ